MERKEEEDVGGKVTTHSTGNGLCTRVVERIDVWYKHRVQVGLLDKGERRVEGNVCETGKSRR